MRPVIAALLLLSGCVQATPPDIPPGAGSVEIFSGSGFIGSTTLKIYETDVFERTDQDPGEDPRTRFEQAPPGTYERVRATLAAGVVPVAPASFDTCPTDWPINLIRIDPPVRGVSSVEAGCEDNGFDALRAAVVADLPQ